MRFLIVMLATFLILFPDASQAKWEYERGYDSRISIYSKSINPINKYTLHIYKKPDYSKNSCSKNSIVMAFNTSDSQKYGYKKDRVNYYFLMRIDREEIQHQYYVETVSKILHQDSEHSHSVNIFFYWHYI